MAEQTGLRNAVFDYPIYGAPWGITFPLLDADGDPISPSSPDSEISKNGDTYADCVNEATEIATSSGTCYLLLTAAEMTADVVSIRIQSTGAKTTILTLYPKKLVTIHSGTAASGGVATSTIVLDAGASAEDDFYNGMACIATIDGNVEVRIISDYVGYTKTATVVPDWNVAPDSDDTFVIKLPSGVQVNQSNQTMIGGSSQAVTDLILNAKIAKHAGYIWLDTNATTNTGTTLGTHGTQDNQVTTIAAALSLSAQSAGKLPIMVAPNSTVTLGAATQYRRFYGEDWVLALGGQAIDGTHFQGCRTITGIATAATTPPSFHHASFGAVTLPPCQVFDSYLTGVVILQTVASLAAWEFTNCKAGGATQSATLDLAGQEAAVTFAGWSGTLTLDNATHDNSSVAIYGDGAVIENVSCSSALYTLEVAGDARLTKNGSGLLTDSSRWGEDQYIAGMTGTTNTFDELQTALSTAHGSGSWESGGAGTGARVVTITVNDGSTVLENAKVRMTNGAESYVVSTNSSGVAAFALDDATWTVSITKPLYTFTSTTLVVNGTETQTYSMTAVSIPASNPGLVSGYVYCYDETGTAEADVTVKIKITEVASSTGYAYDGTVREGTSDATGLVTFTNLFKGATYKIWRGRSPAAAVDVAVAAAAVSPVVLTSFIGEA